LRLKVEERGTINMSSYYRRSKTERILYSGASFIRSNKEYVMRNDISGSDKNRVNGKISLKSLYLKLQKIKKTIIRR
jgi:hypothetical protein